MKLEQAVLAAAAVLLAALFILSAFTEKEITINRTTAPYTMADQVQHRELEDPGAATGITDEYCFTLKVEGSINTLAFFSNHSNVEVYLDEELVYRLAPSEGAIRTHGGNWTRIPLSGKDMGKNVRVLLQPVYTDYRENPEFLIGSELQIYKSLLRHALPEMVLSFCVMIGGIFLLCVALYNSRKYKAVPRLYALSFLAISAGIWRFTYGEFAYLIFEGHTVLVYSLSVTALMVLSVAMLNAVELREDRRGAAIVGLMNCGYVLVFAVQIVLQLTGIADLRQTLRVIHAAIILSAAVLCLSAVYSLYLRFRAPGKISTRNYSWILGLGAACDMLLFYLSISGGRLMMTLASILCFSVLEGIRLMGSYIYQKHALEEMEARLTLSRSMTMMSQIRSHFVFNLLNAISGMCKYDPEKADDTIVRFARYLRSNINIMEDDKPIPFSTDLHQLEDYVILEQVRFGDRITFLTDIEEERFLIPPLILQPVVENSIKHGLSRKKEGGTIMLRTRSDEKNIIITVEDDGIGFDRAELEKEKSVGLKNIRFRLHHLAGGTLKIDSRPDCGTTVTIKIPKKEERP